jgi:hypothetical protein
VRRKAFQPEGGLSSKTSYARKFKELITHTPTAGVAGGALKGADAVIGRLVRRKLAHAKLVRASKKLSRKLRDRTQWHLLKNTWSSIDALEDLDFLRWDFIE